MDCKSIEKKLIFLIEGDLNDQEQKMVEAHLDTCTNCNAAYKYMKNAYSVFAIEKELEVKPFMHTRIQARMNEGRHRTVNRIFMPAMAFTVLVIGLFVGTLFTKMNINQNYAQDYEVAYLFNDIQLENIEFTLLNDEMNMNFSILKYTNEND